MENDKAKLAAWLAAAVFILLIASTLASAKTVYVADISGNIDAGTYQYVKGVLDSAKAENVGLVILRIDTKGGYIIPTRAIDEEIINSRGQVNVVAYASKKFSGAFSAGAYVLVASPIAAVDPQAYVGSAQPMIPDNGTIISLADYMSGLADINHRNASAARLFVINNAFLDGKTAKARGIVEYAPESFSELLQDLNASDATIIQQSPTFDEVLMSYLSNPQIIALFFLLGCLVTVYIIRTRNLRLALIPLVAFAIVLWGVANIEFSLLGIGLIILGVCLISVEMIYTRPTIFGIAGGLSTAVGIIIVDSEPFFTPNIEITLITLALAGVLMTLSVYVANKFGRSALEESRAGTEALIKEKGRVVEELRPNGIIKIHGKLRQAYSFAEEKIEMGVTVQVIKIEGKVLSVIREGGPRKSLGHGDHGNSHDHGSSDEHGGGHDSSEDSEDTGGHGEPKDKVETSHDKMDLHPSASAHAATDGDKIVKRKLHVNSLLQPKNADSNIPDAAHAKEKEEQGISKKKEQDTEHSH